MGGKSHEPSSLPTARQHLNSMSFPQLCLQSIRMTVVARPPAWRLWQFDRRHAHKIRFARRAERTHARQIEQIPSSGRDQIVRMSTVPDRPWPISEAIGVL